MALPVTRWPVFFARAGAPWAVQTRAYVRHVAFDAAWDADELAAARAWRASLTGPACLPRGTTTFARASGPGGQHVNKTESKASTAWPVAELVEALQIPPLVARALPSSRFYTASHTLRFQAQEQRVRSANADANRQKLFDELVALYDAAVPAPTGAGKADKHRAVAHNFHTARLREKHKHSQKKQSRRRPSDD